ncbi:MAG: hypothetical protein HRU15_08075 [Planctomycetes bacterium]|nr:hypothetical protein [Planctomycetota bacterium]
MDLQDLFPGLKDNVLAAASTCFQQIFPNIPLNKWQRNGTWIEYWQNDARIAFAPRQKYSSIYFKNREAVPLYVEIGGKCPAKEVTINIKHFTDFDPAPIQFVVHKFLSGG